MKTSFLFFFLYGLTGLNRIVAGGPVSTDTLTRPRPDSISCTQPGSAARPDSSAPEPINPAVQLTGELALSTGFYATRGLETPRAPVMPWDLNGNLTLSTRSGWTVPVQLVWSSQNNRYGQPYNQLGVSPRYKQWLILHGGYRNVVFSPLTLAGHTFLGVGVELNPGLLRVGAVVGKFNRAINAHHADPDRVVTFRRTGYSAKLGVGNERNYLDLILLRVADDMHSIRTDSLTTGPTPAENLVLGLSGRLQLPKKLFVELDAAGSAYTRDVRMEAVATSTSSNARLRYLGRLANGFTVRQSTQLCTALQASLSYRTKLADLKLKYKRVEPDYQSMGAYYFQTDIENFTVVPSLRLLKKRLNLRTSIGWQHNNLFNQKRTRTNRRIGSLSASYSSDKNLTLDLVFSNYGITQQAGYRPLNDTARLVQNNRTLSGSVFKVWTGETTLQTVTGSATYQALQDLNPFTADLNQNQNWNYTVSYAWQHLAANLDLNVSYGYTLSNALDRSSAFYGPSVSVGKKTLKGNKLSLLLTISYLKSRDVLAEFDQRGLVLNTGLNIDYQLTPVHRLSATGTNGLNRGNQTFRQQQGSVQYSVTF